MFSTIIACLFRNRLVMLLHHLYLLGQFLICGYTCYKLRREQIELATLAEEYVEYIICSPNEYFDCMCVDGEAFGW